MKTIAVLLNVRKNSSRCPDKLLRPFRSGMIVTSLIDIALSKLGAIQSDEKYLCANESVFLNRTFHYSIKKIERSYESANVDGPLTKVFEAVEKIKSDYFMFYNPCCAHIKISTLQAAIDTFKSNDFTSMTSVVKTRDWIYDENGNVLVDGASTGDTKTTPISFRVAHAFHIIPKESFLQTGRYWSNAKNDPYLFEITKEEAVDIDEEYEFIMSESLNYGKYRNSDCC